MLSRGDLARYGCKNCQESQRNPQTITASANCTEDIMFVQYADDERRAASLSGDVKTGEATKKSPTGLSFVFPLAFV